MIDYDLLIISVFSLLFFVIIGGTILLFPIARKLGHLLEARVEEKKGVAAAPLEAQLRQLASRLDGIEAQLETVAERQEFLDRLLVEGVRPAGAQNIPASFER
jgi:hypothetical protein